MDETAPKTQPPAACRDASGTDQAGSAESTSKTCGRWSTARAVLAWAVRVGMVGGLAFGWGMAIVPGMKYRSVISWRLWVDALSYSGLGHVVLWTVHGAVVGLVCAAVVLVSRRARLAVRPGALGLAILLGGAGALILWYACVESTLAVALEPQPSWWPIMAGFWLIVSVAGYAMGHWLAETRLAGVLRWLARAGLRPAIIAVLACLVIRWLEHPTLSKGRPWNELVAASPSSERKDPKPNIVLIVLDTQRVDRLGCYGYTASTTPNLDAFAADAMVFENCISTAIWTLPSHASMLTGLFPREHGVNWHHLWVDDKFKLAPEILKESGYQTICFTNNTFIGSLSNLSRGFDGLIQPYLLHTVRGNAFFTLSVRTFYPAGYVGKWLGRLAVEDSGGKFTNQIMAKFFEQRDRSRPFFLFVNCMEPHDPYRPPLSHRELFVKPEDIENSYRDAWWHKRFEYSLLKRECFTPDQLRVLNQTYDAETRLQDQYLGEMLAMLAQNTNLNNTVIMITADHGECLGDHNILGHAWCVYDTLAHVPLIVRYPKRLGPGRRSDLVQTVDILPTMMDALNGRPVKTQSTFGHSLLARPQEEARSTTTASTSPASRPSAELRGRIVVIERIAPQDHGLDTAQEIDTRFDRNPFQGTIRAIRQGPWKYSTFTDGREELYNVNDDPGELNNLVKARRPIADYLAKRLAEWLRASRTYERPDHLDGEKHMDDESRRRLRDLGYI